MPAEVKKGQLNLPTAFKYEFAAMSKPSRLGRMPGITRYFNSPLFAGWLFALTNTLILHGHHCVRQLLVSNSSRAVVRHALPIQSCSIVPAVQTGNFSACETTKDQQFHESTG